MAAEQNSLLVQVENFGTALPPVSALASPVVKLTAGTLTNPDHRGAGHVACQIVKSPVYVVRILKVEVDDNQAGVMRKAETDIRA